MYCVSNYLNLFRYCFILSSSSSKEVDVDAFDDFVDTDVNGEGYGTPTQKQQSSIMHQCHVIVCTTKKWDRLSLVGSAATLINVLYDQ